MPGVTNSEGGSGKLGNQPWIMATSEGFCAAHQVSSSSAFASMIAGDGEKMERGGEGRSVRWREDLPPLEAMGKEAGKRAVEALGAKKLKSTTATVIFENKIAYRCWARLSAPFPALRWRAACPS